ncbi:HNH endonuclease [Paenibacillus sp. P32E]|uniref:HNH endonuclease n=1 Tax=Paenibacillus sp. P32E TaxID=1349434 RepID=UPI0009663368|nr:HNH endonuclease [Paenibacillus sp. P32E]OKP94798.1 hypothetical protein A3848_02155 [Paenibacillus sp. P32E]
MPHQTFWKPVKQDRVKKPSSLGRSKREKKPVPEHKKKLFEDHNPGKSYTQRKEFPPAVVKEATARSKGICQYCKKAPCQTTHHVYGRGRAGKGVLSNAYRVCGNCHIIIEGDDEIKNEIIEEYRILFGDYFWYDEQDWEEHNQKLAGIERAERERAEHRQKLAPVVDLLSTAAGRALKTREIRFIEMMPSNDLQTFTGLLTDALNGYAAQGAFCGHDQFDD